MRRFGDFVKPTLHLLNNSLKVNIKIELQELPLKQCEPTIAVEKKERKKGVCGNWFARIASPSTLTKVEFRTILSITPVFSVQFLPRSKSIRKPETRQEMKRRTHVFDLPIPTSGSKLVKGVSILDISLGGKDVTVGIQNLRNSICFFMHGTVASLDHIQYIFKTHIHIYPCKPLIYIYVYNYIFILLPIYNLIYIVTELAQFVSVTGSHCITQNKADK